MKSHRGDQAFHEIAFDRVQRDCEARYNAPVDRKSPVEVRLIPVAISTTR